MSIFKKFRRWFIDRYLKAYVSEADREDIAVLQRELTRLTAELSKERAYSAGLEKGLKQRVIVNIDGTVKNNMAKHFQ